MGEEEKAQVLRWQASDGVQVLEGPMLDTWREKAENARENDYHFEFQFLDLKVGRVYLGKAAATNGCLEIVRWK